MQICESFLKCATITASYPSFVVNPFRNTQQLQSPCLKSAY